MITVHFLNKKGIQKDFDFESFESFLEFAKKKVTKGIVSVDIDDEIYTSNNSEKLIDYILDNKTCIEEDVMIFISLYKNWENAYEMALAYKNDWCNE